MEIEYYQGDTLLYGKNISVSVLKKQLCHTENIYDRETDNFIEILCRQFSWEILQIDECPDYTYDRDTQLLRRKKFHV